MFSSCIREVLEIGSTKMHFEYDACVMTHLLGSAHVLCGVAHTVLGLIQLGISTWTASTESLECIVSVSMVGKVPQWQPSFALEIWLRRSCHVHCDSIYMQLASHPHRSFYNYYLAAHILFCCVIIVCYLDRVQCSQRYVWWNIYLYWLWVLMCHFGNALLSRFHLLLSCVAEFPATSQHPAFFCQLLFITEVIRLS